MKQSLVVGLMALLLAAPALADEPVLAGEVKPAAEQKEVSHAAMQAKVEYEHEEGGAKKLKKEKSLMDEQDDIDELEGLEKQTDKKSEQEQKELGKGSETDQKAKASRNKLRKFLAALSGWLRIGR